MDSYQSFLKSQNWFNFKASFQDISVIKNTVDCIMKTINFSAYHPILNMEDHVVFASNGTVLLCYELVLPEIYSLSESDFEQLHGSWFKAFKSLPSGIVIHKQDDYKQRETSLDRTPNATFIQKTTHSNSKDRKFIAHKT